MQKPRILVVDDEPQLLAVIVRVLARLADVTPSETGLRALELLASDSFDIVLCDWKLGEGDRPGTEVLRVARERSPGARRVLMTGEPSAGDEDGAWEVLLKPFRPHELIRALGLD